MLEDLHWSDTSAVEGLAYLAQRREQSHFVNRINPDAVGYLAQEALGGLDHGAALEARNLFIVLITLAPSKSGPRPVRPFCQ